MPGAICASRARSPDFVDLMRRPLAARFNLLVNVARASVGGSGKLGRVHDGEKFGDLALPPTHHREQEGLVVADDGEADLPVDSQPVELVADR